VPDEATYDIDNGVGGEMLDDVGAEARSDRLDVAGPAKGAPSSRLYEHEPDRLLPAPT
jgi:hypothetical protein